MGRLTPSLLAASFVLALAACGGSGKPAANPVLYTSSVCASISTWKQQIQSASRVLTQQTSDPDASLASVRTQFVSFFSGAIAETDAMLAEVAEAGVPDVANGEQAAASLQASLRRFRLLLLKARVKARHFPIGNEERFTTQAQSVGAEFVAEVAQLPLLWTTLAKRYDAPELAKAAGTDTTCRSL